MQLAREHTFYFMLAKLLKYCTFLYSANTYVVHNNLNERVQLH